MGTQTGGDGVDRLVTAPIGGPPFHVHVPKTALLSLFDPVFADLTHQLASYLKPLEVRFGRPRSLVDEFAQKIVRAIEAALEPEGINLVQANGPAAGQTVYHYHTHIFPRRLNDGAMLNWGHTPGDMGRIEEVYHQIMAAMT